MWVQRDDRSVIRPQMWSWVCANADWLLTAAQMSIYTRRDWICCQRENERFKFSKNTTWLWQKFQVFHPLKQQQYYVKGLKAMWSHYKWCIYSFITVLTVVSIVTVISAKGWVLSQITQLFHHHLLSQPLPTPHTPFIFTFCTSEATIYPTTSSTFSP